MHHRELGRHSPWAGWPVAPIMALLAMTAQGAGNQHQISDTDVNLNFEPSEDRRL